MVAQLGLSMASSSSRPALKAETIEDEELVKKLKERRELEPNRKDITVAPEDGVHYEDVVRAMDTVVGEGYEAMSLSDSAGL